MQVYRIKIDTVKTRTVEFGVPHPIKESSLETNPGLVEDLGNAVIYSDEETEFKQVVRNVTYLGPENVHGSAKLPHGELRLLGRTGANDTLYLIDIKNKSGRVIVFKSYMIKEAEAHFNSIVMAHSLPGEK